MSPYATLLAHARLAALKALVDALKQATDPAEIRRLATAILKAPEPDEDIDSEIANPQPAIDAQSPSATSPERSEGTGLPEPATHPAPRAASAAGIPARPSRSGPFTTRVSRASQLLAHSGRAP